METLIVGEKGQAFLNQLYAGNGVHNDVVGKAILATGAAFFLEGFKAGQAGQDKPDPLREFKERDAKEAALRAALIAEKDPVKRAEMARKLRDVRGHADLLPKQRN